MKTCPHTAELLGADIAELRDGSTPDLARHIVTCADCREAVTRILAATDALAGVMSHAPPFDVNALLAHGRRAESRRHAWHRLALGWRRWGARPAAGAVATGAAAMAMYFAALAPEPAPMGESWLPTEPPPRPLLAAAPGHDVVVISTEDPDITIVWLVEEISNEE